MFCSRQLTRGMLLPSDFGAFVGVDMLMDTVKSSFMMTRWFVKMDAKFKGTIGMLTGETDGSTVDTRVSPCLVMNVLLVTCFARTF